MDQFSHMSDVQRLEAAVRRLEGALASRAPGQADADLQRRHDALAAEARAAVEELDRILAEADAA